MAERAGFEPARRLASRRPPGSNRAPRQARSPLHSGPAVRLRQIYDAMAGPSGPRGRENGAQGQGRRPMPWVEGDNAGRPERPRDRWLVRRGKPGSRGPSGRKEGCPFPQGVGLRPWPWAGISRPVGPAGRSTDEVGFVVRLTARFEDHRRSRMIVSETGSPCTTTPRRPFGFPPCHFTSRGREADWIAEITGSRPEGSSR
jgi:hypothetical protein